MEVIHGETDYFIGPFATEAEAISHLELLQPGEPEDEQPAKIDDRLDRLIKKLRTHGIHMDEPGESETPEVEAEIEGDGKINPIKNPSYKYHPVEFENAVAVPEGRKKKKKASQDTSEDSKPTFDSGPEAA